MEELTRYIAHENKRKCLENRIMEFVQSVFKVAEKDNNLDFFSIEISNHQGNLQMDYTLKKRGKAY